MGSHHVYGPCTVQVLARRAQEGSCTGALAGLALLSPPEPGWPVPVLYLSYIKPVSMDMGLVHSGIGQYGLYGLSQDGSNIALK